MPVMTQSHGPILYGPAWFTTSPAELAHESEIRAQRKPRRRRAIVRKRDGVVTRIVTPVHNKE